jgi:hypothetical protein
MDERPTGSNDGDQNYTNTKQHESEAQPVWPLGSQFKAIELGQAFSAMSTTRSSMPWATPLSKPEWLKQLRVGLNPPSVIGAALDRFQQRMSRLLPIVERANEVGSAIARTLEAYPEKMREGLVAMSQSGWYLDHDMGMSEPLGFKQASDEGREAAAEAEMVKHFEERTAGIRAELIQAYPHRRAIFDAAFQGIGSRGGIRRITNRSRVSGAFRVRNDHRSLRKGPPPRFHRTQPSHGAPRRIARLRDEGEWSSSDLPVELHVSVAPA